MPSDDFEPGLWARLWRAPGNLWRAWVDRFDDNPIARDMPLGQRLVRLLTLPFRLLYNFGLFLVFEWTTTRDSRAFLRGLPAVLAAAGFFGLIWLAYYIANDAARVRKTQGRLANYLVANPDDPDFALLYAERWVSLAPGDVEPKLQLANARRLAGDQDGYWELLTWIAPVDPLELDGKFSLEEDLVDPVPPDDESGSESNESDSDSENRGAGSDESAPDSDELELENGELEAETEDTDLDDDTSGDDDVPITDDDRFRAQAHWQLAQLYQSAPPEGIGDEESLELTAVHIRSALRLNSNDPLALLAKAQLARKHGNLDIADEAIFKLVNARNFDSTGLFLQVLPQILQNRVDRGETAVAKKTYIRYRDLLVRFANNNPNIPVIWTTIVSCEVILEEYDQALTALRDGLLQVTDRDTGMHIRGLYSYTRLKQAGRFDPAVGEEEFIRRLGYLIDAVGVNPGDPAVHEQILEYVTAVSDEQAEWMQKMLIVAKRKEILHVLLGARSIAQGSLANGIDRWNIAKKLNRNVTEAFSFYLFASLARRPTMSEIPAAMDDWLTVLASEFPERPHPERIRGLLEYRRQNWDASIEALRKALEIDSSSVRSVETRLLLIEALKADGQDEDAAEEQERLTAALETMTDDESRANALQLIESWTPPVTPSDAQN